MGSILDIYHIHGKIFNNLYANNPMAYITKANYNAIKKDWEKVAKEIGIIIKWLN